jgi:hypothetical protein
LSIEESPDLQVLKQKYRHLFWWVKDISALSAAAVVEGILNYGDLESVSLLFQSLGVRETAKIFKAHAFRTRTNYTKHSQNFFNLYFKRHLPGFEKLN